MTKPDKLFSSFLISFIFSFILLVIIVFFFSHSQQIDNTKFFYSVVSWGRTGIYKTYDFRNYVIGIGLFSLSPFIFYFLLNKKKQIVQFIKNNRIFVFIFFIILFLLFLLILNKIISNFHIPTITEITSALGKRRGKELKENIVYLPWVIFSIIGIYYLIKIKVLDHWLIKIKGLIFRLNLRLEKKIWIDVFMLFLIFFLIFNPRYQYSYEKLAKYGAEAVHQFHHTNFFIGPVNEVLNGKTLLVNARTQYGLLLTYIPAMIFKITEISYANFTLYNILVSVLYAWLFYFVLKKILKNPLLTILGTFGFIKLVFFRPNLGAEIFVFPSSTPIRYFFDIIVIFAVYQLYKKYSQRKSLVTGFFIAFSFFYNTEIGLSLIIAYLVSNVILGSIATPESSLNNDSGPALPAGRQAGMTRLKSVTDLFSFFISFIFIFILISLISYLRSGSFPNWSLMIAPLFFYQKGFFDVGMPLIGPWYFIVGIYLVTFYLLILKWFKKDYQNIHFLFFLLIYGVFSFFYYIGLSEPNHLATVIHPALLLFFILLNYFLKYLRNILRLPVFYQTIIIAFFFLILGYIFWTPYGFIKYIVNRTTRRYFLPPEKSYYWNYYGTGFYLSDNNGADFLKAKKTIDKYSANQKNILLLSRYDTLLLIMTQKASLVDYFSLEYDTGATVTAYKNLIQRIIQEKPKYIYVRSKKYGYTFNESIPGVWDKIKKYYTFAERGGVIDVYRLNFLD